MYAVYADNQLLYSPDMVDDGYIITSPSLSMESNKSGTFQFYIYADNPYFSSIKPLQTQIRVTDDGEEIWRGRVLNMNNNMDNRRTVSCEGVLSFFVDSLIRPYDKVNRTMVEQFNYYISQHNSQVEEYKQFTVKTIDVDDPYGSKEWESTNYDKTQDAIDNILSDYGGYLVTGWEDGHNTISYLKDPGRENLQVINFGENLLDVTEDINPANVFTVLIPIAYDANNNKITIESVNDGKDYLESVSGMAKFGKVWYQHTFEDNISTATELKTKGEEFLEKNVTASHTVSIKALDLHKIDPTIPKINVYDIIKVISEPHGINEYEMCSKVTINLENPESSEYIIGTIPEGITSVITGKASVSVSGGSTLPNGDNVAY